MAAITTFAQRLALGTNSTFIGQVNVALGIAAIAIAAEGIGALGHPLRKAFAMQVLSNLPISAANLAPSVADETGNITTDNPTDTNVQNAVNGLWNHWCNADP